MLNNRWFSIAVGSGLAILLLVGFLTVLPALAQGGGMMGGPGTGGMMGGSSGGFGPGWMMGHTQGFSGTNQFGPGWMMGHMQGFSGANQFGPGWMMGHMQGFSATNQFGPGMMFNGQSGFGGMMGGTMMVNPNNPFYLAPQPLTVDEATASLDTYLAGLNNSNLAYKDIMIFDNHAYAQIVEKDSNIGAMEVLIDPTTQAVYPEMGPNMMWNQKYSMMSGVGHHSMMGGMRGGFNRGMMGNSFNFGNGAAPSDLTITSEQAVAAAQSFLDTNYAAASLTAADHADTFYGYYTLDVLQDGATVGMLSVNGYTGAVWPHTWHGKFLEASME